MFQNSLIYKICRRTEFETADRTGIFTGSPDDKRDGFIHFSKKDQLAGTLEKHFSGETDLVLLGVRVDSLGSELKWETSRGGEVFPHLYNHLDMSLVREKRDIGFDGDTHQLGEGFSS